MGGQGQRAGANLGAVPPEMAGLPARVARLVQAPDGVSAMLLKWVTPPGSRTVHFDLVRVERALLLLRRGVRPAGRCRTIHSHRCRRRRRLVLRAVAADVASFAAGVAELRGTYAIGHHCHFAGALSPSLLIRLLKGEGGAAEWQSRQRPGAPPVRSGADAEAAGASAAAAAAVGAGRFTPFDFFSVLQRRSGAVEDDDDGDEHREHGDGHGHSHGRVGGEAVRGGGGGSEAN